MKEKSIKIQLWISRIGIVISLLVLGSLLLGEADRISIVMGFLFGNILLINLCNFVQLKNMKYT